MSSSKGSMQPTSQTTTASSLPDYLKQPYNNLTSQISNTFAQGTPQAYAPTSLEQSYFGAASKPVDQSLSGLAGTVAGGGNNIIGGYAQQADAAAGNNQVGAVANNVLSGGNNTVGNAANTLLSSTQPVQNWTDPGVASSWMNPYTSTALEGQIDIANKQFQQQQAGRNAQAVNSGAFGGDRQGIADATAQDQFNQQLNAMTQQGLNAAYQQGQQGFQVQQGLGLEQTGLGVQAQTAQNQTDLARQGLAGQLFGTQQGLNYQGLSTAGNLQGTQNQQDLARQTLVGNLLGTQQGYNMQGINTLGTAAGTQQNLSTQQQMLPYQILSLNSGLLGSLPGAQDTTSTGLQKVNPWSGVMGLLGNAIGAGGQIGAAAVKAAAHGGLVGGLRSGGNDKIVEMLKRAMPGLEGGLRRAA